MEEKYLIIAGTDRPGSNTIKIARLYRRMLETKGIDSKLFSLEEYNPLGKGEERQVWQEEWLIPPTKFIFVSPEYNGSIPGILKLLIDQADIRRAWWHKKAMLVGVSTGRAGNLRGMDHLTGILHYLKMHVLPNKLPISTVDKLLDENGQLSDMPLIHSMEAQVDEFIQF